MASQTRHQIKKKPKEVSRRKCRTKVNSSLQIVGKTLRIFRIQTCSQNDNKRGNKNRINCSIGAFKQVNDQRTNISRHIEEQFEPTNNLSTRYSVYDTLKCAAQETQDLPLASFFLIRRWGKGTVNGFEMKKDVTN